LHHFPGTAAFFTVRNTGDPDAAGRPTLAEWKQMVDKLLSSRFALTFHRDAKELAVYALTVARTRPTLTKNETDLNGIPTLTFRSLGVLPARMRVWPNSRVCCGRSAESTGGESDGARWQIRLHVELDTG